MKKISLILLVTITGALHAMETTEPDLLQGFELIMPSQQTVEEAAQEAQQEQEAVDHALKKAPIGRKEQTAWRSFKNKIASIPRGIGYAGQVLGVLSSSRLYLDSTLNTILQEEEAKLPAAQRETFKAVREQVNSITARYEERFQDEGELSALQSEYLADLQFITHLEEANPFGKLSRSSLELLMLTFLKEVRVSSLQQGEPSSFFATWSEFVTDFTAELLNTRIKRVNGTQMPRNPHKDVDAHVTQRQRGSISDDEKNVFLPARRAVTLKAQQELLATGTGFVLRLNERTALNIALAFSGGGYRAMTLTAGLLEALEQLGLLDAATYISTLSGSTWFLAPWLKSGLSVAAFTQELAERISFMNVEFLGRRAWQDPTRKAALHHDIMLPKFAFNQPIGTVDLFGWLLTQALLDSDYSAVLSEQWPRIKDGKYPFPIYTTISMHNIGTPEQADYRYQWYEVNPLEFENIEQGLAIPVWALGREFENGISQRTKGLPTYPFEQSLGYMLGTFGSAYTIDFLKEGNKFVTGVASWLLGGLQKVMTIKRLWPAQSFNPWKGLEGQPHWLQKRKLLTFVDGGIDFNLPILPLLKKERALDVIIIGDASADILDMVEVGGKKFPAEFAKFLQHLDPSGFKYEPFKEYTEAPFIVYQPREDTGELPVLIYINYVKDEKLFTTKAEDDVTLQRLAQRLKDFDPIACEQAGFCGTFNFKYSQDQFEQLKTMGQFNVLAHKKEILNVLRHKFNLKARALLSDAELLVLAAFEGSLQEVEELAALRIDFNARVADVARDFGQDAITPLIAAASQGHGDIVDYLIGQGADVNAPSSNGVTPLAVAVDSDNLAMVNLLLPHNPTISIGLMLRARDKQVIHDALEAALNETDIQRSLRELTYRFVDLENALGGPVVHQHD